MQGHNFRAAVKGALECREEGKKGRKEEEEEQKAQKREEKKTEEVALMCADACSLKQKHFTPLDAFPRKHKCLVSFSIPDMMYVNVNPFFHK